MKRLQGLKVYPASRALSIRIYGLVNQSDFRWFQMSYLTLNGHTTFDDDLTKVVSIFYRFHSL